MPTFGKYANLSQSGWTNGTATQLIKIGQNAHVGLSDGAGLIVKSNDSSICIVHEEPFNKAYSQWRHFLITALQDGETTITAAEASGAVKTTMTAKVTGHTGVKLIFFPGEQLDRAQTVGTIYVIGGHGENMRAAGGPPVGYKDKGGHTAEPTPPGNYVLGPRIHVVAPSWTNSSIAWGSALRINAGGEVEFESSPGKWHLATGPNGVVTHASMSFAQRSGLTPVLAEKVAKVRNLFIDPATNTLRTSTWEKNDFGRWGWNLLRGGKGTPYFVHTTPDNEHSSDVAKAMFLANSHGCIHLVPAERDRLMNLGYLKQGVAFEVRPYGEVGPP